MKAKIFSGVIPALMTPCKDDRTPDFDQLVRKGKELIEKGMSAVVYCGSMGDWPLLTDAQRMEGVERLVKAGVPVIVGTGAVNTASAVAHAAHAQKVGAQGLMVIPRVLSRGSVVAAQKNHFKAILSAATDLPAVIYNSPYYGFATRADLFFALREDHKNLVGFKEFGHMCNLAQAAAKGDPDARARALELESALAVLSSFDEGPDLVLYFKHMMVLKGDKEYTLHFNETDVLSDSQRGYVESQLKLFDTWYAEWSKLPGAVQTYKA